MYGAQMPTGDRQSAADQALKNIRKLFGDGSILRMDQTGEIGAVPVISTGCMSLDLTLGVGGIPRGRVTEVYGPESSGKTTLTLHIIAEAQKAGGYCAFIDAEHALDIAYAQKLGVDLSSLYLSQPDCGEQALEITDHLVRSGAFDLIVIDSVAALTPRSEIEGDMGDNHLGLQARLMSQAMRKLTAAANRTGTAIVFIDYLHTAESLVTTAVCGLVGCERDTPGTRPLLRGEVRNPSSTPVTRTHRSPSPVAGRATRPRISSGTQRRSLHPPKRGRGSAT